MARRAGGQRGARRERLGLQLGREHPRRGEDVREQLARLLRLERVAVALLLVGAARCCGVAATGSMRGDIIIPGFEPGKPVDTDAFRATHGAKPGAPPLTGPLEPRRPASRGGQGLHLAAAPPLLAHAA